MTIRRLFKKYFSLAINQNNSFVIFIAYTFLILYITLLGRHHYDPLSAVWSGWIIKKNGNHWNFDALGNILMFIPWTLSMGFAFPRFMGYNSGEESKVGSGESNPQSSRLNSTVKRALLISFCFSAFIECTQLIFSIGTFQISDLVYNTISGGIGVWVYVWVKRNIQRKKG